MEQEELYKVAQSKINDLTASLTSLNQFSFAKALADVHKEIEHHFEELFKALQQRKEDLIKNVDKLSQELQIQIEAEKKELTDKIQVTSKFVECGVLLYNYQRDLALKTWKKTLKVVHDMTEKKGVQVEFPSVVEMINSHGTVFTEVVPIKPKVVVQVKATAVRTLAGSTCGNDDGQGMNAQFNYPIGIVLNPLDDCLYVCDYNMIRKVTLSGIVSKFVDIYVPTGIAFYQKDQCYFVSDHANHLIQRISLDGRVSTYAGSGLIGYKNGDRMNAMFNYPFGIAVNQDTGDIYVSDYKNHIIRKITLGQVFTLAGTPSKYGYSDGIQSTLFNGPSGICFLSQQQALIVCDSGNSRLRKVLLDGTVSTICEIPSPEWVSVLSDKSVLVSSGTNQILKVSINDNKIEVEVFAGSGKKGYKDGAPLESEFNIPRGIAIDHKSNTCFVVDYGNTKIRAIQYE